MIWLTVLVTLFLFCYLLVALLRPDGDAAKTRKDIEDLVKKAAFTPLSGLVCEPLVNVLKLNVELDAKFPVPPTPAKMP